MTMMMKKMMRRRRKKSRRKKRIRRRSKMRRRRRQRRIMRRIRRRTTTTTKTTTKRRRNVYLYTTHSSDHRIIAHRYSFLISFPLCIYPVHRVAPIMEAHAILFCTNMGGLLFIQVHHNTII